MASRKATSSLTQQLSLSVRPKNLDQLHGQEKMVESIRGLQADGRTKKGWLFTGPLGSGKTTVARILALSYQCTHQTGKWGRPCLACRRSKSTFSIYEINCADLTGIDKLRESMAGAFYGVMGDGGYRVYILDEVHRLSGAAQSLMLKFLEDTPKSTIFILCSTLASEIDDALKSRCLSYRLRGLDADGIEKYVQFLLDKIESTLPADRLSDALIEAGVSYPRLIAMAVEKYSAGESPEEASIVEIEASVDVKALNRSLMGGDWAGVARWIIRSQNSDMRAIRGAVVALLTKILLETPEIGATKTKLTAESIKVLAALPLSSDKVMRGAVSACLYSLCVVFAEYRPGSK